MTYPPGPDHAHARSRPDLPDDIDPTGVPTEATGRETFIMLIASLVAILALIVTVGWIVVNHLGTSEVVQPSSISNGGPPGSSGPGG